MDSVKSVGSRFTTWTEDMFLMCCSPRTDAPKEGGSAGMQPVDNTAAGQSANMGPKGTMDSQTLPKGMFQSTQGGHSTMASGSYGPPGGLASTQGGAAPPAPQTQALTRAERMREAGARLQSFANWPYARSLMPLATPERLAGCGFYHDADAEFDDRVSCAFCHLSLGGWDRNHDPVKEHQKISPRCPFLVQFGAPTSFVQHASAKTELVGSTWDVENHVDDEVQVRADGSHQNVVIKACCSRNSRMIVLVQGPVGRVNIEECARMRVTVLGLVGGINIRGSEEIEITVQEGKPPPPISVVKTNGCRMELSPGAVGGDIVTVQSSAVLLVHSLGVVIVKTAVAPGMKVPLEAVITKFVDHTFVTTPLALPEATKMLTELGASTSAQGAALATNEPQGGDANAE